MKVQFSVRALLVSFVIVSICLATLVVPRLHRQKLIDRLNNESTAVAVTGKQVFIDRLMGVKGPIESILFMASTETDQLPRQLFESLAKTSSITELELIDISVKPGKRYPHADHIAIEKLMGQQVGEWLRGLFEAQQSTLTLEVNCVPEFTDEHLAILGRWDSVEQIELYNTTVSGIGARGLFNLTKPVELLLSDCPISNEGLRELMLCPKIRKLELRFSSSGTTASSVLRPLSNAPGTRFDQPVEVYLCDVALDDETLAAIASCKRLERLTLELEWGHRPLPNLRLLLQAPRALDLCVILPKNEAERISSIRIKDELNSPLKKSDFGGFKRRA